MGKSSSPPPSLKAGADELLPRIVKATVDGPRLREFFRRQTPTAADRKRIDGLIDGLGSECFAVREKASADLIHLGPPALFALRRAVDGSDLEMRLRATYCIEAIPANSALLAAAVWLLQKAELPDDTLAVLLAYLPFAPNRDIEEELLTVLVDLGMDRGRVRPELLTALKDKQSARRAAAALIVGRVGTVEQKRRVDGLLADIDPAVRLRAAQGLLVAGEKRAIPALFTLLNPRFPELAEEAEYLLQVTAGEQTYPVSNDQKTPRKDREAWRAWWEHEGDRIDLTGVVSRLEKQLRVVRSYRQFHEKQRQRFQNLMTGCMDFSDIIDHAAENIARDDLAIAKTERLLRLWGVQPAPSRPTAGSTVDRAGRRP